MGEEGKTYADGNIKTGSWAIRYESALFKIKHVFEFLTQSSEYIINRAKSLLGKLNSF